MERVIPSSHDGPLKSPTDRIQHVARTKTISRPHNTGDAHTPDWGRLPFRTVPPDPHPMDTPHLTRSNTRKFTPATINLRAAQAHALPLIDAVPTLNSPATELKAPASPQKRVMQKVFNFVKGKPIPVHAVTSQGQDFISGPLPPGVTPSKAAQVLGTASTNSRHVLPAKMQSPVPMTPMTPSINGLDLAGTDIHPAIRPQFQARPSAGTRQRSNTFDSSTSLVPHGAALTPVSGDAHQDVSSSLAGLGLQYYEENSPPTPPSKDSNYRLLKAQQPSLAAALAPSSTPRIQIDAAKPYPRPSNESGQIAQSVHGAYETASSASLTHSEVSTRRISKPAGGFSVAASPQLLPGGQLPSWSYTSSPSSFERGHTTPKAGAANSSLGSPTPRKRASLVPSPLRQASGHNAQTVDSTVPSKAVFAGREKSILPSFQSSITVDGSVEGSEVRLQNLEARYASLEERMTARLGDLAGAQSVLVRGVGEWAANCDAVARSTAQVRQAVMETSLEVVEVLQEVGRMSGGMREMSEGLDLMARRVRAVERGQGEGKAQTKALAETVAAMQQQLVSIARGVDSISIYIVRNAERNQE